MFFRGTKYSHLPRIQRTESIIGKAGGRQDKNEYSNTHQAHTGTYSTAFMFSVDHQHFQELTHEASRAKDCHTVTTP